MRRIGRIAVPLLLGLILAGCASTGGPGGEDPEDMSLLARILIAIGFVLGIFGIGWVNRENQ